MSSTTSGFSDKGKAVTIVKYGTTVIGQNFSCIGIMHGIKARIQGGLRLLDYTGSTIDEVDMPELEAARHVSCKNMEKEKSYLNIRSVLYTNFTENCRHIFERIFYWAPSLIIQTYMTSSCFNRDIQDEDVGFDNMAATRMCNEAVCQLNRPCLSQE